MATSDVDEQIHPKALLGTELVTPHLDPNAMSRTRTTRSHRIILHSAGSSLRRWPRPFGEELDTPSGVPVSESEKMPPMNGVGITLRSSRVLACSRRRC
jgi:hypothetical protein